MQIEKELFTIVFFLTTHQAIQETKFDMFGQ